MGLKNLVGPLIELEIFKLLYHIDIKLSKVLITKYISDEFYS